MAPEYKCTKSLDTKDRKEVVFVAQLAEQAERYEEMVDSMKQVVEEGSKLSVEERNLLSMAYKNVVGFRRSSWRMVSSAESNTKEESSRLKMAVGLRTQIETEIRKFCNEVLALLDKYLIPQCSDSDDDVENNVFYMKLRGDYCRYLAEVNRGEERLKVAMESKNAYEAAQKVAQRLPVTSQVRLGLALNYSTYWYDIAGSRHEACKIARKAFDDAIPELPLLDRVAAYKETALILQLLRDNLILWMTEEEEEAERQGQGETACQLGQRGYYR
jgi:hypothetical protein